MMGPAGYLLLVYGSFNDTANNLGNILCTFGWYNEKTVINFKHASGNWLIWVIIRSKQMFLEQNLKPRLLEGALTSKVRFIWLYI